MKRRILFTGEASFLATGFATYNREILKRLHATGKYEVAEMGSWGADGDPRARALPWKFYGVLPNNEEEKRIYESSELNAFGRYKFDSIVADFQPDIVFDVRDPWMVSHIQESRFRKNFKFTFMPTVDSAPQRTEWINDLFKRADVITAYSRYGRKVLENDGVKVADVTSPGIHLDVFKPLDKLATRDKYHLKSGLLIFGTVMRNQKRKLFPDLFDAYRQLRDKYTNPKLIDRLKRKVAEGKKLSQAEKNSLRIEHSALLCHTSWPDMGWDIPKYLARYQLQRHVIFTFKCDDCGEVYVGWMTPMDASGKCICRVCGKNAAHTPSTNNGVSEDNLVEIYNLIDIYLQPAICEGWGLPIVEAKACGVPGLYQNYSAMEDHVENGGGLPIKIGRYYHEAETAATRTLPDLDDMISKMEKLAFDEGYRARLGAEARQCAERMHSWDVSAAKLDVIFSTMELLDRSTTWDRPALLEFETPERPPANLSPQDFVAWCYINLQRRLPDQKGFSDWMNSLNKGGQRDEIEAFFRNLIRVNNKFEEIRWAKSLALRGIKMDSAPVEHEDYTPGVLL